MPVLEKKYKVTCKGMNPNGTLLRMGETFYMDPDRAENMRASTPHLTFEEADNEDIGTMVRAGRESNSKANPRLHADNAAKPAAKKRGRPRLQR